MASTVPAKPGVWEPGTVGVSPVVVAFKWQKNTCLQEIVPKRFVSSQLYTLYEIMCSF